MNDHHRLRRLAGVVVEGNEIVKRRLGDDAEAGAEPERVFQAAGNNAVDNAHVHDIREVIARGGLACRQADRARVSANNGGDAGRVHLFDLGIAAFRRRLCVAEHRFDFGAAQCLDPTSRIDLFDRHHGPNPPLLAGVRQRARDRVQHANLDGGGLRAQQGSLG
jgi:hypothetical protein